MSRGWFYLDDFRNLSDAHRAGLTWHFLASPIGNEHFQPGGRFMHWLAGIGGHPHYRLAVAFIAVNVGPIGYFTARVADELFGDRVLHIVLAGLMGTSSTLVETSTWYAGSDAIPSTALMAASLLLYARWFIRGRWPRLAGSIMCAGLAILFWEQAIIMPFLLALLWMCFMRSGGRRPVREVALSLVPFVIVSIAFSAYVSVQSWSKPLVVPSIEQVAVLVRTMFFRGLLPPIVGWRVATLPLTAGAVSAMILASAILLTGAGYLIWRGRFRWSGVVFFALSFLALAATVATTRVGVGPLVGATPRYLDPMPMLVGLSVAGCASGRRGVAGSDRIATRPALSPRVLVAAAMVVVLGVAYLSALTVSTRANKFGRLNGQHAHAIYSRASRILHPGMTNLVDTRLRWPVFYTSNDGSDEVSTLSLFWAPDIHAIGQGNEPIAIAADGSGHHVRFNADRTGPSLYVRLVVTATQPGTLVVTIHGVKPAEPNQPYRLAVPVGRTSFILPAWAASVSGVALEPGPDVAVTSSQLGTITLGPALQ